MKMLEVDCDKDAIRAVISYNPDNGTFVWLKNRPNVRCGEIAGGPEAKGYLRIMVNGRRFKAHRLAWMLYYGEWPTGQIDHINRNKADNRISNLRDVSQTVNQHNRITPNRQNTTGYMGVSWNKRMKKYISQIQREGEKIYLGLFDNPQDAYAAYLEGKKKYHKEAVL